MDGIAIVPPIGGEGYVSLSRTPKGHLFEKHILNYGDLLYPGIKGGKVTIDDKFADTLISNFQKKYCGIVQVPKAGPKNEHSEDPDRNIGEVVGLTKRNGKIYAQIDVRDESAVPKMGKTYLGASAMFHLNYTDRKTMTPVGPTLVHVAVTNHPFVSDLDDYEEIAALTADGNDSGAVILTALDSNPKEEHVDFATIIATLKADHGIDLPALQEKAAKADAAVALSSAIIENLGSDVVALSADSSPADLISAVQTAGDALVALSTKVAEQEEAAIKAAADTRVDGLVKSGHILPKNRDAQVTLLLSNPDLFEQLLPEKAIVKLSASEEEHGFTATDSTDQATAEAEIARLTALPAAKQYIA